MDLSKINSTKLYLMRNSQNATEIDAELDRRNEAAAKAVAKKVTRKPRRNGSKMVDHYRENNRWYIQDDGTVTKVEA